MPRTVMNAPRFDRSDALFIVAALGLVVLCGTAVVSDFGVRYSPALSQATHEEPA
jgi:hypothetical protein